MINYQDLNILKRTYAGGPVRLHKAAAEIIGVEIPESAPMATTSSLQEKSRPGPHEGLQTEPNTDDANAAQRCTLNETLKCNSLKYV